MGVAACNDKPAAAPAAAPAAPAPAPAAAHAGANVHLKPGELDSYYGLWSGGHTGDIRVLGAASYATPVLSTAFLILAGYAKPTATLAIAAALIAGGGLIAAKDMIAGRKS